MEHYFFNMDGEGQAEAESNARAQAEYEAQNVGSAPDTAVSVLEMFSPTREGIMAFSKQVIDEVKDGKRDPLRMLLLCKTLEDVAETIRKGTKDEQAKQAAMYGEKPFPFQGAELHYTATRTEYKYDNCNDSALSDRLKILEEAKKQVEERQAFLKALPEEGLTEVNEGTGEVVRLRRPLKLQTMGVKVSIR